MLNLLGAYVFYENKNGYNFRSIESLLYAEINCEDVDYQFNENFCKKQMIDRLFVEIRLERPVAKKSKVLQNLLLMIC